MSVLLLVYTFAFHDTLLGAELEDMGEVALYDILVMDLHMNST
jgi:hypothetical protein